ncbi:MAG: DUF1667 domain-containing protein [Thermodesulfobacteriota bacterium]
MKTRNLVCIVCPNGCPLEVDVLCGETPKVTEVRGNLCDKGPQWAEQEVLNPVRSIAGNILVRGGVFPLVSVKTDTPVPLGKIFQVMDEINDLVVDAPVYTGDRLILEPAGTKCCIVATRNVSRAGPAST